jgi:phosphomannomutase
MTLIKSISGIRGTIGGVPGEDLTPLDIVKFTSAYSMWLSEVSENRDLKVVVGRDARVSGPMVEQIVCATLSGMGVNVVNLEFAATPTVEILVLEEKAAGGIIITASHNPGEWNALKLLDNKGEFISAEAGQRILNIAGSDSFNYSSVEELGAIKHRSDHNEFHINKILKLELVQAEVIRKAGLKVVIDCVNSVGGLILPDLLRELGVKEVIELYCEPSGIFPHNPEPLPENLSDLSAAVREFGADVGLVVDPDVDRLAVVDENGNMFGEEYTLVAVADYVLGKTSGNTVSNLSSTRALKDITEKHGYKYFTAAVGEVNVVAAMKENQAVIGGEGNGGVIYPPMHYGRDALTGSALFLSYLAESGRKASELRKTLPDYYISKNKITIKDDTDVDALLERVKKTYGKHKINSIDGVKIDLNEGWIHLRKSNTEAIIRIYTEAKTREEAIKLAEDVITLINDF